MKKSKLGFADKLFWSVLNGVEQYVFAENFIVSNLSPYEEILSEGIMSVRHYAPLKETEIEISGIKIPVSKNKLRVPVVLVPPLAATSMRFCTLSSSRQSAFRSA